MDENVKMRLGTIRTKDVISKSISLKCKETNFCHVYAAYLSYHENATYTYNSQLNNISFFSGKKLK